MATHSSILSWRIPWTGEPGGLPSMGLDMTEATQQQQQHIIPECVSLFYLRYLTFDRYFKFKCNEMWQHLFWWWSVPFQSKSRNLSPFKIIKQSAIIYLKGFALFCLKWFLFFTFKFIVNFELTFEYDEKSGCNSPFVSQEGEDAGAFVLIECP